VTWAEQGWTPEQREFYHFTSQGTIIMPVKWFMALEQPPTGIIDLIDPFSEQPPLSNPDYLARFGLISSPKSTLNPWGLPVGLAVAGDDSPARGSVGATCAACHTGELRYRGHSFRVDGSQAMADIVGLIENSYTSLLATQASSEGFSLGFTWRRFSRRVLGSAYNTQTDQKLRSEVAEFVKPIKWIGWYDVALGLHPTKEGYGRTDAIGRIGNRVFGTYLQEPQNLHVANAPVNFPQLWDIWKYDWVQFDASVAQPMARNAGEALGVMVATSFLNADGSSNLSPDKWATSIHFENLEKIETQLQSLQAPRWPRQILGAVNMDLAKAGRSLFTENCAKCHAPRPVLPPGDSFAKLAVTIVDAQVIGTDPQRVLNSSQAQYDPSKLFGVPSEKLNLGEGLFAVTEGTKEWFYDTNDFSPEKRGFYDGFDRPNAVGFKMQYKAVPLDGIWATAPYLHNGSVRNMYELLSPVEQRARKFWVGLSDYDPVLLGLGPKSNDQGFELDTAKTGNGNGGHEFNGVQRPGVIGRLLSHDERMAIIEYLKVLPEMPPDDLPAVPLDWLGPYSMVAVPRSDLILTEVSIESGTATVRFATEANRIYQLESTSSLGPEAIWSTLGEPRVGSGQPEAVTGVPITDRQAFFRVRVE
ncbi:MAG: di-heme-cytochrome C peroxidase, partial [Limisphaerales bacterium]